MGITHVIGDDFIHPKKPDTYSVDIILKDTGITKDRAIYVGDSDSDVQIAKNAGIISTAVSWGFRDRELLKYINLII